MSLTVLHPGLLSLLVDAGRPRWRALGVPVGGAADRAALALGNALVGNPPDAPAVEFTLSGPALEARHRAACVVFGAPFSLTVNRNAVAAGRTFTLQPGDVLRVGGASAGARGYLCVAGGFEGPEVLGSRSGLYPLKAGDVLACPASWCEPRGLPFVRLSEPNPPVPLPRREGGAGPDSSSPPFLGEGPGEGLPSEPNPPTPFPRKEGGVKPGMSSSPPSLGEGPGEGFHFLRVLDGPQRDWFSTDRFFTQEYEVSPASNRMGVRLKGEQLARRPGELVSEAVAPGAVQVTNDGLPVVLGVDGQTIGGYPKVAHVIRADLDPLAQFRPGERVRFVRVSPEEAEAAARNRAVTLRAWLARLRAADRQPVVG